MSKLQGIKTAWLQEKETYQFRQMAIEPEDIDWLIEQAEKYQRIRDKMIEQTIQRNHEALKKLADS